MKKKSPFLITFTLSLACITSAATADKLREWPEDQFPVPPHIIQQLESDPDAGDGVSRFISRTVSTSTLDGSTKETVSRYDKGFTFVESEGRKYVSIYHGLVALPQYDQISDIKFRISPSNAAFPGASFSLLYSATKQSGPIKYIVNCNTLDKKVATSIIPSLPGTITKLQCKWNVSNAGNFYESNTTDYYSDYLETSFKTVAHPSLIPAGATSKIKLVFLDNTKSQHEAVIPNDNQDLF